MKSDFLAVHLGLTFSGLGTWFPRHISILLWVSAKEESLPFQSCICKDQFLLEGDRHDWEKCLNLSRKKVQRREKRGLFFSLEHFRACYELDSSGKVQNGWSLLN